MLLACRACEHQRAGCPLSETGKMPVFRYPFASSLLVVNFDQSDAGLIVFSGNDGGIGTGSEADSNGRFQIVRRSESAADNRRGLVRLRLPVPGAATSPAAVNRLTRLWAGEVGTV